MSDNDVPPPKEKLEIRVYSRPDGDHPIYAAVGNIAAEWAYFEHVLDQIIGDLLDNIDNARIACMTAQIMGAAPRYRAIIALLKLEESLPRKADSSPAPDSLINKVNSLQNRTYDIADRRNRIVHDPWYVQPTNDQPSQFRSMPSKEPRYGMKDVDRAYLSETYEKIVDLVVEASKLRVSVCNALASWRGKPPPPQPPTPEEMAHSREILREFLARIGPSQG